VGSISSVCLASFSHGCRGGISALPGWGVGSSGPEKACSKRSKQAMTRFGFNLLVMIYLAPLVLMDIVGNTISTGTASDFFYYKSMFDGLLIAYAAYELWSDNGTASHSVAKRRAEDHDDQVVSFEKIASIEYIYCIFLAVYALGNWYTLHEINANSTGVESIGSLVWSFVSIAVAILSGIQFYRLKSGALVELKHKIMN
jgi:hypothetical protein